MGRITAGKQTQAANKIASSHYRFWATCLEGTGGTLIDHKNDNKTGADIDGTTEVNGGTSQAWVNTGWFTSADNTTGAGDETRAYYATADLTVTATQCLCLSFRMKRAAQLAGQDWIVGTQANANGTESGFRLSMLTTGVVNLHISDAAGNHISDGTHGSGLNFGGDTEDVCTLFLDNATQKISMYKDGVIGSLDDTSYAGGVVSVLNDVRGFTLGCAGTGQNIITSNTCQFRDVHALVLPSIPANIDQIARHFSSKPFHPLRDVDIELS